MRRRLIGEKAMTATERQRDVLTKKAMTKYEREDLARLVRTREKVMQAAATQGSAEFLAAFERQMASVYS